MDFQYSHSDGWRKSMISGQWYNLEDEKTNMQNTDNKAVTGGSAASRVQYTINDVGCYVDGAHGIYAPGRIVDFAIQHGANIDTGESVEDIWDAEDECDEYMNGKYGVEGAYWGRNESGDWGLWEVDDYAQHAVN